MPFKSKTIRQLILMLSISIFSNTVFADRIKDFTDVAGQRPNQLVGYGLVVGLDGRPVSRHRGGFCAALILV